MSKTLLFQAILFSICTLFSSIWPIDRTLSGATTPGESGPGSEAIKRYSSFPKPPALLELHNQIVLCQQFDLFLKSDRSIFDFNEFLLISSRDIWKKSFSKIRREKLVINKKKIEIRNVWWFYRSFKTMILRFYVFALYCSTLALSTLAKGFSAAASVIQSSSKELSTRVADRV